MQTVVRKTIADEIEAALLERYGPLIRDEFLSAALGFPSMEAFRQALSRHVIPIPVFSIPKRRGKFALVRDVACWLAEQRELAQSNLKKT